MIISSYRLKPIQLLEKTNLAKEYQGWTTRDAEIPWAGSLRRISRGSLSSVEFYFRRELCRVFVVSAADRKRSCRGLRANTNLLSRSTFTAAVQVPSVAPPPPPPFNEQISIRCSGLQFKSFAVFGISWNGGEGRRESELFRVIATTVYI